MMTIPLLDSTRRFPQRTRVHAASTTTIAGNSFAPLSTSGPILRMTSFHHDVNTSNGLPISRVQTGIRNKDPAYNLGPDNYPSFLWRDGSFTRENMKQGFLENHLLVRASLIIGSGSDTTRSCLFHQTLRYCLISPSAAEGGNRSSKKGYAALHKIKHVTTSSIAYAATLVRPIVFL